MLEQLNSLPSDVLSDLDRALNRCLLGTRRSYFGLRKLIAFNNIGGHVPIPTRLFVVGIRAALLSLEG